MIQPSDYGELLENDGCLNEGELNNLVAISKKSIGPNIRIPSPGNPSAYFAPISPAAKTSDIQQLTDSTTSNNPLMDILHPTGIEDNGEDVEGNKMLKCRIAPI